MAEEISTHVEPQGESAEHVEAMLEAAEGLEQAPSDRPDWLPEKFTDVEQMAQAYQNLEKRLGSEESEGDEEYEEEFESLEEAEQTVTEVSDLLDDAGLDFGVLQQEYAQLGELSPEAYEALEEAGFPEELVQTWIAGQEALNRGVEASVYDLVGGQETYSEIIGWAAETLSETQIAAYDKAVSSGDIELVSLAVQGLQSQYRATEGQAPQLLDGGNSTSVGGRFGSWTEVTTAMRDPRYDTDIAYRQQVASKLASSNIK
jgi:anion-transporting  ArsA/GET3 family ATPase